MSGNDGLVSGPGQTDWRSIAAVTVGISVLSVMIGLSHPLIAFNLNSQGVSPTMIGLNAAMLGLGLLIAGGVMPSVLSRFGLRRTAIVCVVLTTGIFVLYPVFPGLEAWFVIRFLHGLASSGIFIICDTWINRLAPQRLRGRILGLYATIFALGFAIGPAILVLTGAEGWPPFLSGVGCGIVSLAGIMFATEPADDEAEQAAPGVSALGFVRHAPALLIAFLGFGLFEAGLLSLLPIYLLDFSHTESAAAILLATLILGSALLQIPIGFMADWLPGRTMFFLCVGLAVLAPVLLPALAPTWGPLLVYLFLWGGFAFGIYTLAMKELGDRFTGKMLIAGNAAFAIAWSFGNLIGPAISGGMIAWTGLAGLPVFLGGAFLPVLVIAAVRSLARRRRQSSE
ncbi:MAG: MFS transporter [Rhodospirillales bacterium]